MTSVSIKNISGILKLLFLAGMLLPFAYGCLSIKPGNTTSSSKLYETFFAGETGTQYYFKPTRFVNPNTNEEAWPDITFRYKNTLTDSATINISLLNLQLIKSADSIVIFNGQKMFPSKFIKPLFTEKTTKFFHSRFSVRYSLTNINDMFSQNQWVINVYTKGQKFEYAATKKTKNTINKLNQDVIVLFR